MELLNNCVVFPQSPDWSKDITVVEKRNNTVLMAVRGGEDRGGGDRGVYLSQEFQMLAMTVQERARFTARLMAALRSGRAAVPYWARAQYVVQARPMPFVDSPTVGNQSDFSTLVPGRVYHWDKAASDLYLTLTDFAHRLLESGDFVAVDTFASITQSSLLDLGPIRPLILETGAVTDGQWPWTPGQFAFFNQDTADTRFTHENKTVLVDVGTDEAQPGWTNDALYGTTGGHREAVTYDQRQNQIPPGYDPVPTAVLQSARVIGGPDDYLPALEYVDAGALANTERILGLIPGRVYYYTKGRADRRLYSYANRPLGPNLFPANYPPIGVFNQAVTPGADYVWTMGAGDSELTNGPELYYGTATFTAVGSNVTLAGHPNIPVAGTLRLLGPAPKLLESGYFVPEYTDAYVELDGTWPDPGTVQPVGDIRLTLGGFLTGIGCTVRLLFSSFTPFVDGGESLDVELVGESSVRRHLDLAGYAPGRDADPERGHPAVAPSGLAYSVDLTMNPDADGNLTVIVTPAGPNYRAILNGVQAFQFTWEIVELVAPSAGNLLVWDGLLRGVYGVSAQVCPVIFGKPTVKNLEGLTNQMAATMFKVEEPLGRGGLATVTCLPETCISDLLLPTVPVVPPPPPDDTPAVAPYPGGQFFNITVFTSANNRAVAFTPTDPDHPEASLLAGVQAAWTADLWSQFNALVAVMGWHVVSSQVIFESVGAGAGKVNANDYYPAGGTSLGNFDTALSINFLTL